MRLKGKNVLVTGGANGIGRALVEGFLGEGASVVFSYLNDRDSAECVVAQAPEQVLALQCNLGDRQQARELVRSAIHTLGSIDVMVNNVGAFSRHAFVDLTDAALDEVMQVNLHSPFLMTQAVARHMIEHGTRAASSIFPRSAPYAPEAAWSITRRPRPGSTRFPKG
ncbi:SDR family oxidoreductase [Pseudomonas sp. MAFF212428]|uniref:SDR family oxidoreductase n=1 Tax=Pseudomonas brassicae TaxID=2708063 RepID=A0A6M0CQ83_9PSED|nr:SDR family oxidoreductase [Pseudomonas brassicae]